MPSSVLDRTQAFKFALDPNPAQEAALSSHCGAARFAYNHMLHLVRAILDQRESERSYGISEELLTPHVGWSAYSLRREFNARKAEVAPWWSEVSKEAFASGSANLAKALKNFTSSKAGKRAGARVGFPSFKSKTGRASCTFTTGTIRVNDDRRSVTLPRLGRIHTHESTKKLFQKIESGAARITTSTVSRSRGRWFVTFVVHIAAKAKAHARPGTVVGIDVGVSTAMVAATPEGLEVARVALPASMKHLVARRRQMQRRNRNRQAPRRGVAPSRRWLRAQASIAAVDARIANLRENAIHQMTTDLTRRFETVVIENLNVVGMMTRGGARKRGLNRGIANAAFGEMHRQVAYKTGWVGGKLVRANRFYPSSKTCSGCGAAKAKLPLSERQYDCDTCGLSIDRDLNAAINLARLAGECTTAGSGPVAGRGAERKTGAPSGAEAAGDEASTPDGDRLRASADSDSDAI